MCVPQNLVRKLCTFYKGHTQDIVFCQRLQYDENGEKELFFAGPLARHVTRAEYRAAVRYMENCGIRDGFTQERTSAREEYTPAFDLTGV